MAKLRLELDGIRACLADVALAGWVWYYSNAVGGVKVLVKDEDLARAMEILNPEEPEPSQSTACPPRAPMRWTCLHCGVRVPSDLAVCWSCGTTPDGQPDPEFAVADAPPVEHDLARPPTIWWPAICLLCLPLAVYEVLLRLLPDQPRARVKRRVTFAPLDSRLVRACLLAMFAISWFPPFSLWSLWLLHDLDWGKGVQRRRTGLFLFLALAIDLVIVVWWVCLIGMIGRVIGFS